MSESSFPSPQVHEGGVLQSQPMDAFLCVHSRDIEGLLDVALASYCLHYPTKGRLTIVTNDPAALRRFLDTHHPVIEAEVTADNDWLSTQEMELPGWFRQQIIKLRSHHFCSTEQFCNLGADTLLARPISMGDLVAGGMPVMYFTRHRFPDRHWQFERQRVRAVASILRVEPREASSYTDFINDFFCFDREWLIQLDCYMQKLYGKDAYGTILNGLDASRDQTRFGEWTLYNTFILDYLQLRPILRDANKGYLNQIHGWMDLMTSRFQGKVIHVVNKKFDRKTIANRLQKAGSPIHGLF